MVTCPHCKKEHEELTLIHIDEVMEYLPEFLQDTMEMRNDND